MTMTTFVSPFPLHALDVNPMLASFSKIGKAIDNLDYILAVELTSATINQIRQSLLFTVLEHRAYALSKINKFEAAIQDAKEMIAIEPTLLRGYLVLCNIYALQRKQQHIIDVYETALQNIKDHSSTIQQQQHQQLLIQEKNKAVEQNKKRVDFLSKLPRELLYSIFSLLDQRSKSICCWNVSKTWRNILLKKFIIWSTLNVNDNEGQVTTRRISRCLPHISTHIRTLTIDTRRPNICSQYFFGIYKGYFNNIKSLQLKMKSIKDMEPALLKEFLIVGIPQLGNTLTELELDFLGNKTGASTAIKLSDILFVAPKLRHLEYTAPEHLSDIIGDFTQSTTLDHPLIDLHLSSLHTTRNSIEPLLKYCRQLLCLNLHYCMEDFTDLFETNCPNLQLLGYNFEENYSSAYGDDKLKNRRRDIRDAHCSCDNNRSDNIRQSHRRLGLKELYMADYSLTGMTKFQHFMSLIKNNAATLEVININDFLSISRQQQQDGNLMMDEILELSNLKKLTIGLSHGQHPVANLLLRSALVSPALGTLRLPREANLLTTINSLLLLRRPLQNLKLALSGGENDNDQLLRLFRHYSSLSSVSLSSPFSSRPASSSAITLDTIGLADEARELTDKVLDAISDIKTVKIIDVYSRSTKVSMEGLSRMFKKLDIITHIELGGFEFIDDKGIVVLGHILKYRLTHIRLYRLNNLTTFGVILLMEYTTHLKHIIVSDCPMIEDTKAIEEFAKRKGIGSQCYC